jgi:hypothetical protein
VVAAAPPKWRIPQVVFLIASGILIGPHGLGLADTGSIKLLANTGLGFLFLLARVRAEPAPAAGPPRQAGHGRVGCQRRDLTSSPSRCF